MSNRGSLTCTFHVPVMHVVEEYLQVMCLGSGQFVQLVPVYISCSDARFTGHAQVSGRIYP